MPAIIKEKHRNFCKMMSDFSISQTPQDKKLSELEAELYELYRIYQLSLNEIKICIMEYEIKQKEIRQRMRELLFNDLARKKKYKPLAT